MEKKAVGLFQERLDAMLMNGVIQKVSCLKVEFLSNFVLLQKYDEIIKTAINFKKR